MQSKKHLFFLKSLCIYMFEDKRSELSGLWYPMTYHVVILKSSSSLEKTCNSKGEILSRSIRHSTSEGEKPETRQRGRPQGITSDEKRCTHTRLPDSSPHFQGHGQKWVLGQKSHHPLQFSVHILGFSALFGLN